MWAVREEREGVSKFDVFLSNTFYRLLNLLGEVNLPPRGSDFALLDRKVFEALLNRQAAIPALSAKLRGWDFVCANRLHQRAAGRRNHQVDAWKKTQCFC